MFGKKEQKPQEKPATKPTWDDPAATAATPKRSQYFDALRTEAYKNNNLVRDYIEFWAAVKVNPAADKWRVMHYMIFDLNQVDGKFSSEAISKNKDGSTEVSFAEAVEALAKAEYVASKMELSPQTALEATYPAKDYPELKEYYYDLPHFKGAANLEGFAFGNHNEVYRRVSGKVVADATFTRAGIKDSLQAAEQGAAAHPQVQAKIEGGILAEIYNSASSRTATLDNILKVGEVLVVMDEFAAQVGGFYLDVQRALGLSETLDNIGGLTPDAQKKVLRQAEDFATRSGDLGHSVSSFVNNAAQTLSRAESLGVHVEPFQKFAAECELYANLLEASRNLAKLERSFTAVAGADTNLIVEIRQSVDKAQKKFTDLGGTAEETDRLKAWVANPKKDNIPGWLPGFMTRYYESRGKVMKKVQERQAGVVQAKTMPAIVKPPVANDQNPGMTEDQRAIAGVKAPKP